jgi:hypothetical protein
MTFVTMGFDNLKTAVNPMSEEDEIAILVLLLEKLSDLYPLNLCTDIVCDRFMEGDVFDENKTDRTDLILIGASNLANIARHVNHDLWNITDLTRPGWRVTSDNGATLAAEVTDMATRVNMEGATVILQLLDNSVYKVGGPGGEQRLPGKDQHGLYHVDSSLVVAGRPIVKDMMSQLGPLIRALGTSRKIFLNPLAGYWVCPCCNDPGHVTNYRMVGYLPRQGESVHALRDHVRDSLFTRKVPNFRVLCPNCS